MTIGHFVFNSYGLQCSGNFAQCLAVGGLDSTESPQFKTKKYPLYFSNVQSTEALFDFRGALTLQRLPVYI